MIPSLIYADRYRNEGTRTYSKHADYTEAQEKYRPNSRHTRFDLAVFEVPRDQMCIYTANPPIELATTYLAAEKTLFCIHPQMLEENQEDPYIKQTLSIGTLQNGIAASPSSSTRTLYVIDDEIPHAIKVHFPFRISRYGRRMRDEVVEQAINISMELERGIHHLDDRFAFLREVIGVAHRSLQPDSSRGENWGYLVRDMKPFPIVEGERNLIPGFSLYDKFMGSHFFDRILASCLKKYPDLKKEDFRKPCRDEFAWIFPGYAKYLPKTIRYFSEERDQFGKPFYQDTGKVPDWRP